ncbi:hypothetical protein V500_10921 [Pseudogymnoascus sp. VKM F-4518 (FW-2643)]|nr:hypothetical protein V500_10921 [Pseudogymnoascus sp. VKM F-4518 (FW-2643)]
MFSVGVYLQIAASLAVTFLSIFIWTYLTSPGPNLVSLSDPKLVRTVYNTRGDYLKSKFYDVNSAKVGHEIIYNVFSTRSNKAHAHAIRPIRKLFTLSSLLKTEPLIDATIQTLLSKIDSNFVLGENSGKTCKMDNWLPFFAWDVIGRLTFGVPMGYLDNGCDFDGSQRSGEETFFYFACVGQIPELDYFLAKNPVWRIGPPAFNGPAILCAQRVAERQKEFEIEGEAAHKDMLEDFMRINREDPGIMDDNAVVGALIVNVLAGGDTTGILLCAIIYYVLKDQSVYRKLMEELDAANLPCPVSYTSAEKLPYFDAVVKEAARMHPGVGLILERVVPAEGLTLEDGRVLSPGTIVGMNAWVIHQNKEIFGDDAASFNPERWLRGEAETEEGYQARLSMMKSHDLTFGAGKRVCMGRSVSILETYKVMSTLFLTYEADLQDVQRKSEALQNSVAEMSKTNNDHRDLLGKPPMDDPYENGSRPLTAAGKQTADWLSPAK